MNLSVSVSSVISVVNRPSSPCMLVQGEGPSGYRPRLTVNSRPRSSVSVTVSTSSRARSIAW